MRIPPTHTHKATKTQALNKQPLKLSNYFNEYNCLFVCFLGIRIRNQKAFITSVSTAGNKIRSDVNTQNVIGQNNINIQYTILFIASFCIFLFW